MTGMPVKRGRTFGGSTTRNNRRRGEGDMTYSNEARRAKRGVIASIAALICASALCNGAHAEEVFDLNGLIEAAKKEPPITVYAVTGEIVDTAQAFTKKYG